MSLVTVGEGFPWKGAWWVVTSVDVEKGVVTIEVRGKTEKQVKREKGRRG